MDVPEIPPQSAAGIIQPCSEACLCFQKLSTGGWSDFGICTNPQSPRYRTPVRIGQECDDYQAAPPRPQPRQD